MSDLLVAPKVAIIYYSQKGTVHALAESIADGADKAGAEVRLLRVGELAPEAVIAANPEWAAHRGGTQHIREATPDDAVWADALILGSPTRFGNIASQLKQFLDTLGGLWQAGRLADKVYSGFTATATRHGGHESTLLALYASFYHFGGVVVAPGYTDPIKFVDGNPYGASHTVDAGDIPETTHQAAAYQGTHVTRITRELLSGRSIQT